jgi:hypothetical protein
VLGLTLFLPLSSSLSLPLSSRRNTTGFTLQLDTEFERPRGKEQDRGERDSAASLFPPLVRADEDLCWAIAADGP